MLQWFQKKRKRKRIWFSTKIVSNYQAGTNRDPAIAQLQQVRRTSFAPVAATVQMNSPGETHIIGIIYRLQDRVIA
ncbi:MAG: hypothetical protein R3C11_02770 [Planctomycetaceae bacterium]